MADFNSGVYVICSPSNRCYIGSTKNFAQREKKHFYDLKRGVHHNPALQQAYIKYGEDLNFIVIERCHPDQMIEREQWWIDNHGMFWGRMYNASGIAGRPEHTPEVRKKIGDAQRGRKHTDEHKSKVIAALRKRRHTPETKAKMSAIMRSSPERLEQIRNLGKTQKVTQEQIERIAAIGRAHKGRKMTDEARAKMSAPQKARFLRQPMTEDHKRKLRKPKSEAVKIKMSASAKASWTPERKATAREKTRQQLAREALERVNWIAWG